MKKKSIYAIWIITKYGTGIQPVKADSKMEARRKFKKRFPKKEILDIMKSNPAHTFYSTPI